MKQERRREREGGGEGRKREETARWFSRASARLPRRKTSVVSRSPHLGQIIRSARLCRSESAGLARALRSNLVLLCALYGAAPYITAWAAQSRESGDSVSVSGIRRRRRSLLGRELSLNLIERVILRDNTSFSKCSNSWIRNILISCCTNCISYSSNSGISRNSSETWMKYDAISFLECIFYACLTFSCSYIRRRDWSIGIIRLLRLLIFADLDFSSQGSENVKLNARSSPFWIKSKFTFRHLYSLNGLIFIPLAPMLFDYLQFNLCLSEMRWNDFYQC